MRRGLSVSHLVGLALTSVLVGGLVAACSGSSASGFNGSNNGTGQSEGGVIIVGADGSTTTTTTTTGGNGPILQSNTDGSTPSQSDAACGGSVTKAQQSPLDIYMMLDQSQSMSESNKWPDITAAIEGFVAQSIPGISVGLQFFGLPASGGSGGGSGHGGHGGGTGSDSCTASDYATPAVAIAAIPGVAPAIKKAISAHSPSTETPTSAALQGTVDYAQTWAKANPTHVVIGLLATDGDPTECDTTISNIDAIAAAGVNGTPKVLTFVIGVGSSMTNLNSIAAAGGTTKAFMVSTTGNINQQFTAALQQIRGSALGCQYKVPVPEAGTPNYNQVNVVYTPGGGSADTIPNVASSSACPANGDGWYYDNPASPSNILLCGSTCTKVQGDSSGSVDVEVGCATVVIAGSK